VEVNKRYRAYLNRQEFGKEKEKVVGADKSAGNV